MRDNSYIQRNIQRIRATLPQEVTLIAVSKYHPAEAVAAAYETGQRDFGESKAQDLVVKHQSLPSDIRWHFIGHLQSNKIKYIAPFIHLIHSIDSYRLLKEVDKQGAKNCRRIPCLLQIHIAKEESKFGFTPQECLDMLRNEPWRELENIEIRGLMCMASNTCDEEQIKKEFTAVGNLFREIKKVYFSTDDKFRIFSAGMSDDHPIAIECGSTHIRIGSGIFCE